MSVFNMMLGGGSSGWKTASATTSDATAISFTVESEPQEFMLFFADSDQISTSNPYACIVNIVGTSSDGVVVSLYYYDYSARFFTIPASTIIGITYESGTFTISMIVTGGGFLPEYAYILIYR